MCRDDRIPDWVLEYMKETMAYFNDSFKAQEARFPNWGKCFGKYVEKAKEIFSNPFGSLRSLEEIHNELCVADALLGINNPYIDKIEYEPKLPSCKKTIDYRCEASETSIHIDVKTITPKTQSAWDKFVEIRSKGLIAPNNEFLLDPNYMGGEFWHSFSASRGRMLEYTLELEGKILQSGLATDGCMFILALCGDGVNWHVDQLEDFVNYYRTGKHRYDDGFALMESHYVKEKGIEFSRNVAKFIYLERSLGGIQPKKVVWDVSPPQY